MGDAVDTLADMFAEALVDAGNVQESIETKQAENNAIKHSDRYGIDNYSEKEYNDFGWATHNKIWTANERNTIFSRFADYKHNRNKYPTTKYGEAVIYSFDHPSSIVYIKGSISNPKVTKIVRIEANIESNINIIKEEIIKNEFRQVLFPYEAITNYFGQESISIHRQCDYESFREYDRRRKGENSRGIDTKGRELQNRRADTGSGEKRNTESKGLKISEKNGHKYSFGGRNSKTANTSLLASAQQMENEGKDTRFSERNYSYKALISKPDMHVTAVNDNVTYKATSTIRKTIVNQSIKNAVAVGRANVNGNAVVHVKDIDTDIVVSKKSLMHGLDRRLNLSTPVMLKIGEVLSNSIRINELTPKQQSASASYVLIGYAVSKTNNYIVRAVVNKYTNEVDTVDVLYAVSTKKETAGKLPGSHIKNALPTVSTISISNLLDYVNRYFPDILPENVLKHYGHTERPAGEIGKSALFSERDTEYAKELEEVNAQISKENKKLKEDVSDLKELLKMQGKETHGKMMRKSSIEVWRYSKRLSVPLLGII